MQLSQTAEFEFRRRYLLAPTDPRFLDCTPEEILVDVWAHRHVDDPNLRNEVISTHFDQDLADMEEEAGAPMVPLPPPPDPGDFDDILADDAFG